MAEKKSLKTCQSGIILEQYAS